MITETLVSKDHQQEVMILISEGSVKLGFITKFKPKKGYIHPWKAFAGVGFRCKMINVFYGRNGRKEAIKAVINASN